VETIKQTMTHEYLSLKDHEMKVHSLNSKVDELTSKLRQAESDRDTQTEEVYRVRRLMREEKEHKEESLYRHDKEKRAREALEAEVSEHKQREAIRELYIRNVEAQVGHMEATIMHYQDDIAKVQ
jgi:multidrug resistance efflux pump